MDDYEQGQMYFIDIMFTSYTMGEPPIKGYFLTYLPVKTSQNASLK